MAARACLRSLGLEPKKDVIIVSMGSDAIRYSAIKAGSVEAIIAPLPRNIQLKKEGLNELCYAGATLQGRGFRRGCDPGAYPRQTRTGKAMLRGVLKTSRSLTKEKNSFIEFLVTRVKLDRDVASETAAVLIDAQTKNGIIEEPDLLQVIETERQSRRRRQAD